MKKILVISDNSYLVSFFQQECNSQGVAIIADVMYCYSSINKSPASMIALGATSINIKDQKCLEEVKNKYDLVISLHCKQIFPAELVVSIPCINIHPGFNPFNRGWYPQVFSIINKKPIGATIHLMDEQVDHGDIIDQEEVEVIESDTSLDVYEKVMKTEQRLINKNLLSLVTMKFSSKAAYSEGNYNSIADFKSLCKLDLNAVGTLREHIDILRALTHGNFNNAFFCDKNEEIIFVRVVFEPEIGK